MVRHKTRWMLVQLDGVKTDDFARKDLASSIRQNIVTTLGLAGEGAALETQVRLWDPPTRLLLVRVPRDEYAKIRASLTVWTNFGGQRIVASVLSVHGSARTAKRGTLGYIRKWVGGHWGGAKMVEKDYKRLQELISSIQSMD